LFTNLFLELEGYIPVVLPGGDVGAGYGIVIAGGVQTKGDLNILYLFNQTCLKIFEQLLF